MPNAARPELSFIHGVVHSVILSTSHKACLAEAGVFWQNKKTSSTTVGRRAFSSKRTAHLYRLSGWTTQRCLMWHRKYAAPSEADAWSRADTKVICSTARHLDRSWSDVCAISDWLTGRADCASLAGSLQKGYVPLPKSDKEHRISA